MITELRLIDMVSGYKVSTVELPFMIPVSAPDGGAAYETMVFELSADGAVIDEVGIRRYATPEAARKGHADMVRKVTLIEDAFAF
ncbi:hypothetical protein ABZ851_30730 [Streptomyces sp. NPDC047049]|uniref:hypothetical protein n=1 Tax=Streptomyces sp. NPDC047049 TaxID=3156688 RepID=UPI0033DD83FF